jgi:hypothetical protein
VAKFYLLTRPSQQPKAKKGEVRGVMTFVLHLAPSRRSGFNVCPQASLGCIAACLNLAGHGGIGIVGQKGRIKGVSNTVQEARIRKTRLFFADRPTFMHRLELDIRKGIAYAARRGFVPAFRLNGTSDIAWELHPWGGYANLMAMVPGVQFYDYTKVTKRLRRKLPANYHLTFSLSEENTHEAWQALQAGFNVAVVFRTPKARARALWEGYNIARGWGGEWQGQPWPVLNGDATDLRWLDQASAGSPGRLIGLYAKGELAKADASGFVRD